jgi:hypothetical protein
MQVYLQPIAYMVEMKEQLEVSDLKGNKIGVMNVSDYLRVCIEGNTKIHAPTKLQCKIFCPANKCLYVL